MTTYVLTLKTWEEFDRAHHWYGRIHWLDEDEVPQYDDSRDLPDETGYESIRHATKQSVVDGAQRWFAKHARPGDRLVIGTWSMLGLVEEKPVEVLATAPG